MTPDQELADELARFYADPLGHVMFSYPWSTEKSIQLVRLREPWASRFNCEFGPDVWACEFLDELGAEVRGRAFDGRNAVPPIQFSTASGHGIGKSALCAWIIKWIMDTRPLSRGTVTANTDGQLRTKTWAELGRWHRMSPTEHWFTYSATRGAMHFYHKSEPQNWRCEGQTCRQENSEAFAGQHAPSATSFYVFDEASGVPDKIFEVREGGTTDGEPMTFDFGNPTRNSGQFFENCVGRFRHRYIVRSIDSRSVQITNKERIQKWIDDWGEDSDFVRVRVRGEFPSIGSMQFIPTADVDAASARELVRDRYAPLVLGVDVARFGDDESVIFPRLGTDARSFPPWRYRGLDTYQLAERVVAAIQHFRSLGMEYAGLFVDGGGLGAGVVDALRHWGHRVTEVNFGGSPTDKTLYRYRVDEMWGRLREAIHMRLCLPNENAECWADLRQQLTQREFGYTISRNLISLETKADMKDRGLGSPDLVDALALTYAADVQAPMAPHGEQRAGSVAVSDYDPLAARD